MEEEMKIKAPMPPGIKEKIQQEFYSDAEYNEEIFVVQKKLIITNDASGCRFCIASELILNKFLSDEEEAFLQTYDSIGRRNQIDAKITDPGLKMGSIKLWKWLNKVDSPTDIKYYLGSGWNRIVTEYDLKEGELVRLWAVRLAKKTLCFVLVRL
ncbi:hypothetical protein ACH5RR_007512 [Cinchona calisaya]|uniref:TF-B3 domain-containing protein n=1 Tax=Cinchona calisaya TaxID=153742 RepID=A0ABD3ASD6_9GENT